MSRMPRVAYMSTVPMTLMFLVEHARHFAQLGWEVHAISADGELLHEFGRQTGARVHPMDLRRRIEPMQDLRVMGALVPLMRRARFDVVHAVSPKGGLLGMTAARLAGVPTRIYHVLGMPAETATGITRSLLEWSDRLACLSATHRFCVSRSLMQRLIDRNIVTPDRMEVLGAGSVAGIDANDVWNPAHVRPELRTALMQELGLAPDRPVIGYVGRLEREKGIVELLAAHATLQQEHPEVQLLIAGGFEARGLIPDESLAHLRGGRGVHWLQRHITDPAEMAALYSLMDVLVLPSYREGLPTVLLEGAAMGVPAVATAVTGCVDIVRDGETGHLVPLGDVPALTHAIAHYARHEHTRRLHGAAAREFALAAFRREPITAALEAVYTRADSGLSRPHHRLGE